MLVTLIGHGGVSAQCTDNHDLERLKTKRCAPKATGSYLLLVKSARLLRPEDLGTDRS